MTTPEKTDFKCKANIGAENTDGGIDVSMKMVDLNILFHPLEGSAKAQTTSFIVKVDGVDTDLNEIFEPVASGLKIPMDTKFSVGITDLRDIFAGKDTIPTGLVLEQLPRGEFTCDTYLSIYYDRSGSMEAAFSYITPAIEAIRSWFSKTLYGDTAAGRALAQQYVKIVNPAHPIEKVMCWIANGGTSGPIDTRAAGREVSIGYINESDPAPPWGGTGHMSRDWWYPECDMSSIKYGQRWKALTDAGGTKHAAIMGVWHPDFRSYPAQIDREINEVVFEGKALKDMGVSAFFGIYDNTPSSKHVEIIANWLNIPVKPEELTIVVTPIESDEHEDKVQWKFSSEICGLTHIQGSPSIAFLKTQKCWKIEVKDEDGLIVETITDLGMRPETHTYTTTDDQKPMTDFYCRLTAVGMTGYTDKDSGWVLCKKIAIIPPPPPPPSQGERRSYEPTDVPNVCETYGTDAFWLTQNSGDNVVASVTYGKQQYRTLIVADPDNGTTATAALPGPFNSLPSTNKYSVVGRYQTGIHTIYPINTDLPDLYNYQSNTTITIAAVEVEAGTALTTSAISVGDTSVSVDSIAGAGIGNRFSISGGITPINVAGILSDIDSNTISWDGPPSFLGIGPGALFPYPIGSTVTYKEYHEPEVPTDKHLCTAHSSNLSICNFTNGYPKRGSLRGRLLIGNQLTGDPSSFTLHDYGLTAAHKQWLTNTYANTSQWQYSTSTWRDPWSGQINIYAIRTECPTTLDASYISALKACDPTFDETGYIYDDTHYAVLIANWTFNGVIAQIELNILWVCEGAQSTGSFSPNQVSDIGGVNINNTIPTGSEALMSSEHTAGYCFTRIAYPRNPGPATQLLQNFKAPLDSTSLYNATTKPGSLFHSYTNESISRPDACGAGFTNYEYNYPGSIMPGLQSGYGGLPDTYFLNAIGFRRNGVSQIDSLTPTHKSMINGINLTSGWTGGVGVGVFIYPVKKA